MADAVATPAEILGQADEALRRAEWDRARGLFSQALEHGETPEALEGLGMAAFFLDETALALESRERAYTGFRDADRPVDAARVAIALAWDYRAIRGQPAVSDGWLARARRLLQGRGPSREQGWLALREASFALPGDGTLARERCAEAEALARELGDVDLEMTAIALDGLVRVSEGEIAAGMARLDEATTAATAGDMRDPVAIGFSCCYLIFACERVRDFERADQWCERLARMAEGWNIRALRAVCRAHYGTVLILRGEWSEAEAVLSETAAIMAARPGEAGEALARLAELRRRQGRPADAEALLSRAGHHHLAVLSQAALALDGGEAAEAEEGAARYLRLIGGAKMERVPGLELLAEAYAAGGRTAEAKAVARELTAIAELVGTDPLLGAARHAEGHARAAAGDADGAREAFEDAVELLGKANLPFETARARVALATALRDLGRERAARRELRLARERFAALGADAEERRAMAVLARPRAQGARALSAREGEVLRLVADGLSNKQIASRRTLSEHTVHRHVANILVKLGLSSRAAAAAHAVKHGLID
jgi:LuxR family maltose regulon positive regulatory protein